MEGCDLRKIFAAMLVVAPLIAACGMVEEPLLPELKGRWDMVNLAKMQAARVQRASSSAQPAAVDHCSISHVMFGKSRVVMRAFGLSIPLFYVADVKRDGQRLILTGGMDSEKNASASNVKLVLMLRNGELRFDDIFDERGRSAKHARIPDDNYMRRHGATTLGEGLQVILDLKPCPA